MNRLPGTIAGIETSGSIALVDVDALGQRLTATLLGATADAAAWTPGMPVALLFAETEVALAKNLSGLISMRNRINATVVSVERGSILAKVVLDVGGSRVVSIITSRSSTKLDLKPGDRVEALVKANEMSVLPAAAGETGAPGDAGAPA